MMEELYADEWIVVINKPSGLPAQRTQDGQPGAYEALRERYEYVGLHHRLDRPASGLMVFTTHPDANSALAEAFRSHAVQRRYRAVLYGIATSTSWTWPVDRRPARSDVTVLHHERGLTAVKVSLTTGRKHQIRVHAAMAGVPIVGDRRYGQEAARRWPRLALHAHQLTLPHPITGEEISCTAPIPQDLTDLWNPLADPKKTRREK